MRGEGIYLQGGRRAPWNNCIIKSVMPTCDATSMRYTNDGQALHLSPTRHGLPFLPVISLTTKDNVGGQHDIVLSCSTTMAHDAIHLCSFCTPAIGDTIYHSASFSIIQHHSASFSIVQHHSASFSIIIHHHSSSLSIII
eukprot:506718-Pyramimonas_sp.AAC.1